jgi:hypothetical protein
MSKLSLSSPILVFINQTCYALTLCFIYFCKASNKNMVFNTKFVSLFRNINNKINPNNLRQFSKKSPELPKCDYIPTQNKVNNDKMIKILKKFCFFIVKVRAF